MSSGRNKVLYSILAVIFSFCYGNNTTNSTETCDVVSSEPVAKIKSIIDEYAQKECAAKLMELKREVRKKSQTIKPIQHSHRATIERLQNTIRDLKDNWNSTYDFSDGDQTLHFDGQLNDTLYKDKNRWIDRDYNYTHTLMRDDPMDKQAENIGNHTYPGMNYTTNDNNTSHVQIRIECNMNNYTNHFLNNHTEHIWGRLMREIIWRMKLESTWIIMHGHGMYNHTGNNIENNTRISVKNNTDHGLNKQTEKYTGYISMQVVFRFT